MQLTLKCPPAMKPHLDMISRGEYDIPYNHPRPVVLDVGANIGGFAIWAIRRWPSCEIHCYEPLPQNFEVLKTNIEILKNAGITNQININNCAIGDPRHSRIFLGRNNCGEASFFDLGEQTTVSVEVVTHGSGILPRAQILKMDTEGCEIEILSGLPTINFDAIMLEYHSEKNRRDIDSLLQNYVLIGGHARCLDRGVLKYLHKRLVKA
jgi:FkbM family methyltransferase